jgi:hypothetical protein
MNTYKIVARPDIRYALAGGAPLTENALKNALAGLMVRELREDELGRIVIDVRFQRPTHERALNEIVSVVRQFGFSIVEVTVSELVSKTIERAIFGLLGGGAVGIASENPVVAAVAAAVGLVAGGLAGAEAHRLQTIYDARWNYHDRCWVLRQIPQQPSARRLQPDFSQGLT